MSVPSAVESIGISLVPTIPAEPVLPISVEGYHALLEAGILQDGDPIELLEGFLMPKLPRGPRHAFARRRLQRLLRQLVPNDYFVDGNGVLTTTTSEPEPDVLVIRGDIDDYAQRHPGPTDVLLVIEVAEASLGRDRHLKKRIYARATIACYWVVNLMDHCIDVCTQPSGNVDQPAYGETTVYRPGDAVPVVVDGKEIGRISVAQLLAGVV